MSINLKLAAINKIEENGTSVFEFDDINWWPLIRVYLFQNDKTNEEVIPESGSLRNKLIYPKRILWDLKIWMQTHRKLNEITNINTYRNLNSVDICFVTSEANYKLNTEKKLINRYLDPLYIETTNSKAIFVRSTKKQNDYVATDVLSTNYFEFKCLAKKQFNDIIRTIFFLKKKPAYSERFQQHINQMIAHIQSFNFFENYNFSNLTRYIDETKQSADVAESIFNKVKPKQVVQYCYYYPTQLGYTLAANKLGIKTVDYQHGSQNEFHYAYGSWNNVPSIGYELLPAEFWVFSNREEKNLSKSFYNTPHKVKVIGNMWIKYWRGNKLDDGNLLWLQSLRSQGFQIALFSVSSNLLEEEHYFWDYLKNSKTSNLYFLFRLHPGHKYLKDALVNKLNKINFNNYNIDDATRIELYDILNVVDLHLTQNSTIAEEALNFNLSTIVMDEIGRLYFEDYIKTGDMFFPTNIQNFNTYANQLITAKIKS